MSATMNCRIDARRRELFANANWNGIDYVEVADDQLTLSVYFFSAPAQALTAANFRIDGGRRVTGIAAIAVNAAPAGTDEAAECLQVTLNRYGDFSTYSLRLVENVLGDDGAMHEQALPGFDPRYDHIDFDFKTGCASDFDCVAAESCPDDAQTLPPIDYLVKDYASFRQLILDRLAVTMPDWRERHVPDIGVTLVELLAYVADQLSYYQDAVATEAYLDTARTRISVRRHARLVDYRLHEGCNARAWLTLGCTGEPSLVAGSYYFVTAAQPLRGLARGQVLQESALQSLPSGLFEVFEPVCREDVVLHESLVRIRFYTWGDEECCLPKGATRATLYDPAPSPVTQTAPAAVQKSGTAAKPVEAPTLDPPRLLAVGDVLIFEEVLGPTTGNPADADPRHRCAVRLTRVAYTTDALLRQAIVEIEWAWEDALPFALCLSARLPAPDCRRIGDISVARGNVILVDHGACVDETVGTVGSGGGAGCCGCEGVVPDSVEQGQVFAPILKQGPLIYREPPTPGTPATIALAQDPHKALAQLELTETAAKPNAASAEWNVRCDLLRSGGDDRDFVVEVDDDGAGHLRFGDGRLGRRPDAGSRFAAKYRVGNQAAGNVAAEAIAYIVLRNVVIDGANLAPRNPLPAQGGTAPETLAEARLAAPHALRKKKLRAITADDYARLAEQDARLQRANAQLNWTGSWYEADVAIDPLGSEDASPALRAQIDRQLEAYRRVGHDLAVRPAIYVPLAITLQICVLPDYLRGHVQAALADALGNRRLADGSLGFFHPDRLSFGEDVYASDLIAAAQRVEGVQSVNLLELRRQDEAAADPPPGVLELASSEIAQVDNDPDFPEHGQLKLRMGGGR
ncbi:MAG: putative baseplate assembly protein [Proteobacteria bacterium]|nr:putative baseplate assembly protein [Pseudomonadota bacterium]